MKRTSDGNKLRLGDLARRYIVPHESMRISIADRPFRYRELTTAELPWRKLKTSHRMECADGVMRSTTKAVDPSNAAAVTGPSLAQICGAYKEKMKPCAGRGPSTGMCRECGYALHSNCYPSLHMHSQRPQHDGQNGALCCPTTSAELAGAASAHRRLQSAPNTSGRSREECIALMPCLPHNRCRSLPEHRQLTLISPQVALGRPDCHIVVLIVADGRKETRDRSGGVMYFWGRTNSLGGGTGREPPEPSRRSAPEGLVFRSGRGFSCESSVVALHRVAASRQVRWNPVAISTACLFRGQVERTFDRYTRVRKARTHAFSQNCFDPGNDPSDINRDRGG